MQLNTIVLLFLQFFGISVALPTSEVRSESPGRSIRAHDPLQFKLNEITNLMTKLLKAMQSSEGNQGYFNFVRPSNKGFPKKWAPVEAPCHWDVEESVPALVRQYCTDRNIPKYENDCALRFRSGDVEITNYRFHFPSQKRVQRASGRLEFLRGPAISLICPHADLVDLEKLSELLSSVSSVSADSYYTDAVEKYWGSWKFHLGASNIFWITLPNGERFVVSNPYATFNALFALDNSAQMEPGLWTAYVKPLNDHLTFPQFGSTPLTFYFNPAEAEAVTVCCRQCAQSPTVHKAVQNAYYLVQDFRITFAFRPGQKKKVTKCPQKAAMPELLGILKQFAKKTSPWKCTWSNKWQNILDKELQTKAEYSSVMVVTTVTFRPKQCGAQVDIFFPSFGIVPFFCEFNKKTTTIPKKVRRVLMIEDNSSIVEWRGSDGKNKVPKLVSDYFVLKFVGRDVAS